MPRPEASLLSLRLLPGLGLLCALLLPQLAGASLRVAVISDLNGSYGSTEYEPMVAAAVQRIIALQPDLVISTGDMVAGQRRPHLSRLEIERMWQAFDRTVRAPLAAAGIPLAATPGNHDASAYAGFARERQIYAKQWTRLDPALTPVNLAGFPLYYAFAQDDVLFVSLDATVVGHLPEAQLAWLQNLLRDVGAEYRQRVLFSHLPLWPVAQGREREFIGDPALQALLAEADVDLYLSGHHHAFYPGALDATAHVSQGCLGAGPRRLLGERRRAPRALTLLELDGDRVRIAALRAPDFLEPIDWQKLPEQLAAGAATLIRADLVPGVAEPLSSAAVANPPRMSSAARTTASGATP